MNHIKQYMKKVDAAVSAKMKQKPKTKKGLLSPSGTTDMPKQSNDDAFNTVVDIVYGLRQSREEMKNA